jgi:hypothetical protein
MKLVIPLDQLDEADAVEQVSVRNSHALRGTSWPIRSANEVCP